MKDCSLKIIALMMALVDHTGAINMETFNDLKEKYNQDSYASNDLPNPDSAFLLL